MRQESRPRESETPRQRLSQTPELPLFQSTAIIFEQRPSLRGIACSTPNIQRALNARHLPEKMKLLYWSLGFFLSSLTHADPADDSSSPAETELPEPCTISSPVSGSYFDLNPLHIRHPDSSSLEHHGKYTLRDYSWNTTGYDMGYNFTLNFCGGVVEDLEAKGGVQGLERELWKNVSAFYEYDNKVFSIG